MKSFILLLIGVFSFALLSDVDGKSLSDWRSLARHRRKAGIFPGTLWCGAGNVASSPGDLATGTGKLADKCCREHDSCPTQIRPYKFSHGILNLRPWPISHCSCDTKFYNCLTNNSDTVSDSVGTFYFNKLGLPCFDDNGKTMMRKYIIQTDPSLNSL